MPNEKRKSDSETIAAQATPPGRGGVGIIRVSGPLATSVADKILGKIPSPRNAVFSSFKNHDNSIIDEGISLYFEGPNSFTGEDVLELQGHGGQVVLDRVLQAVLKLGVRIARPGEFSERAYLNGKLDLAQAEAIVDLINATSEEAAKSAVRSLQGEFSKLINRSVKALIHLRMMVESAIDFPEEEIDFLADSGIENGLKDITAQVKQTLISAKQGALLQEGMTVVIAGAPNAGKSSLLNCLSGKDAAIVTDIAGTTRDTLREYIHLEGMPVHIVDTAGIRETTDLVEIEGVQRARSEIQKADIVLLMVDGTENKNIQQCLSLIEGQAMQSIPVVIVKNKIDLCHEKPGVENIGGQVVIKISAKKELGVEDLKDYLKQHMGYQKTHEGTFIARRRHLEALGKANDLLESGYYQLKQHQAGELLAEDLRLAQQALGEITGEFTPDDLLGEIFSNFCIGK